MSQPRNEMRPRSCSYANPSGRYALRQRRSALRSATCTLLQVGMKAGRRRDLSPEEIEERITEYLSEVGASLRAGRLAQGLKMKDLAQRAGVSVRRLVDLEAGEGNATLRTMAKISLTLGVSLAEVPARGSILAETVRAAAEVMGITPAAARKRRRR